MANNEHNQQPPNPTPPVPPTPPAPVYPQKLSLQQTLEKELGLVKVMDYIAGETFDLAFQPNVMQMYEKELVWPLLGDSLTKSSDAVLVNDDRGLAFLHDEYIELNIQEKTRNVLNETENICRQNGLKEPMVKKMNKMYMIIMVAMMIGLFSVMSIEALAAYSNYIMFPVIMIMCFVPQVMRNSVMKKWNVFKTAHKAELQNRERADIENIRVFIQDVLDDARERMIQSKIPLQNVNFILFSRDYKNIKIMQNQDIRGTNTFNVQFEYPEGMQPFTDPKSLAPIETTVEVSSDDENDQFIVLRNAKFNDDGQLVDFSQAVLTPTDTTRVESILAKCKFSPVDQPDEIIKDFVIYDKIRCSCTEPIQLKEIKYCVTNENPALEFYLIIGQKCKCVKNPFVIFISPGIKDVPTQYKNLFF